MVGFATVVLVGMELLNVIVLKAFAGFDRIPMRAKHLDKLETKDWAFIVFNRLVTIPFLFLVIRYAATTPGVKLALGDLTLVNTVGAIVLLFLLYDMVYVQFHKALHIRALYPLVHKHHHRQHAPSRGNTDAVNVHPFEFVSGEFLHLLCVMGLNAVGIDVHAVTILVFIVFGGIMASLNHTRADVRIPPRFFDVRAHDLHHRDLENNYGQYSMYWDRLLGSYKASK